MSSSGYQLVPLTLSVHRKISNVTSGSVSFGLIPREHWFQPDWIDEEKAAAGRAKMSADGVVYGGQGTATPSPLID